MVANDPPFAEQLANLRAPPFGGDAPVPGTIESADRFVRASYYLHHLPELADTAEAVAGVAAVASTVSVPPGAPYDDFSVYPTWWVSAADFTGLTYYFWSRTSPAAIWVELPGAGADPRCPGPLGGPGPTRPGRRGVRPAAAGWAALLSRSGPGDVHRVTGSERPAAAGRPAVACGDE